nr:cytochrome c-type biogenesis protein [uncultured Brevundimonas sp.]
MRRLLVLMAAPFLAVMLTAAEPPAAPDRPLADATQEARAQALFKDVRCVVCQHEAIADSPAGVAGDMRRLIREEIASGATDQQVRDDLVRRFGDYVLFTPPVRAGTWLLWFGPFALVISAATVMMLRSRRRAVETPPLSLEEEARLDEVLRNEKLRRDPDATSPHDGR